jgi:hypothetical protein
MKKLYLMGTLLITTLCFSQFRIGSYTADASAVVNLGFLGYNKGLVLPRGTTLQRNAADGILSPVGGIVIYDTTLNCMVISLENGKWKNACTGAEENTTLGTTSSTGKVGVGISSSLDKNTILEVVSSSKGVILPLASADLAAVTGMLYYNVTNDTVRIYNGTSWTTLTTN